MQPKTKIQRFIVEQSKSVQKLNEKALNWSKTIHDSYVTFSYKEFHHCMECNHRWRDNQTHTRILKKIDCPCCKKKLIVPGNWDKNSFIEQALYFHKIEVVNNIQIVRVFSSRKWNYKKQKPKHNIDEVAQHWILENGKTYTLALKGGINSGYYGDNWVFGSGLEFRSATMGHYHRTNISLVNLYPEKKFSKYIKKRGIKSSIHGITPDKLFRDIIHDNKLETLFKIKQFKFAKYCITNGTSKLYIYWKSLLICNKLNYKVKDVGIWLDLLDLLDFFGKDIKSPKYICPDNLKAMHDRYVKKKKEYDRKKELKDLKSEIKEDEIAYKKNKGKYFDLKFVDEDLVIEPLKSVIEVFNEGEKLNHCLFANKYHRKKHSLLFSAKINNENVETIEVSLKKFQILQSRGINNNPSSYNERINLLVNNNMNLIIKTK